MKKGFLESARRGGFWGGGGRFACPLKLRTAPLSCTTLPCSALQTHALIAYCSALAIGNVNRAGLCSSGQPRTAQKSHHLPCIWWGGKLTILNAPNFFGAFGAIISESWSCQLSPFPEPLPPSFLGATSLGPLQWGPFPGKCPGSGTEVTQPLSACIPHRNPSSSHTISNVVLRSMGCLDVEGSSDSKGRWTMMQLNSCGWVWQPVKRGPKPPPSPNRRRNSKQSADPFFSKAASR